jgi:hypothetical protein
MMLCNYALVLWSNQVSWSAPGGKRRGVMRQAPQPAFRCAEVGEDCRARAEQLLGQYAELVYNSTTRVFVLSTELLVKIHNNNNSRLGLTLLQNAVRRLKHGDKERKSWAASFSKLLAGSWRYFGKRKWRGVRPTMAGRFRLKSAKSEIR